MGPVPTIRTRRWPANETTGQQYHPKTSSFGLYLFLAPRLLLAPVVSAHESPSRSPIVDQHVWQTSVDPGLLPFSIQKKYTVESL